MTETSTLTPHQILINKLKESHPQKQLLVLIERIEALENKLLDKEIVVETAPATPMSVEKTLSRSEKMKAAWAKRKAAKPS